MNLVNDRLDVIFWGFLAQEREYFLAFIAEWRVYNLLDSNVPLGGITYNHGYT